MNETKNKKRKKIKKNIIVTNGTKKEKWKEERLIKKTENKWIRQRKIKIESKGFVSDLLNKREIWKKKKQNKRRIGGENGGKNERKKIKKIT